MAHFYGSMDGSAKTTATRCGTKNSGLNAHIRGWDIGVKVEAHVTVGGEDELTVYVTGGNNGSSAKALVTVGGDGRVTIHGPLNPTRDWRA